MREKLALHRKTIRSSVGKMYISPVGRTWLRISCKSSAGKAVNDGLGFSVTLVVECSKALSISKNTANVVTYPLSSTKFGMSLEFRHLARAKKLAGKYRRSGRPVARPT